MRACLLFCFALVAATLLIEPVASQMACCSYVNFDGQCDEEQCPGQCAWYFIECPYQPGCSSLARWLDQGCTEFGCPCDAPYWASYGPESSPANAHLNSFPAGQRNFKNTSNDHDTN